MGDSVDVSEKESDVMKLEITKEEQQLLIVAMEAAVKHASNSLQAASVFMPLVMKLQDAAEGDESPPKNTQPKGLKPPRPKAEKES